MKQTAVDWLKEQMNNIKGSSISMNGRVQFIEKELNNLLEQAKEIEIKQREELIKKACSLVFLAIGDGGDITTNEVIEILKKDGSN